MKKILYPLILLALAAAPACKSKKMAQNTDPAKPEPVAQSTTVTTPAPVPDAVTPDPGNVGATGSEALGTDDNSRLLVSFISKGEGIDYKTSEVFEKFLAEYRPAVTYEKVHWGREGEIDYCLKLTELSTKDQDKFVQDARIALANKPLVLIEENTPCVHKH